MAEKKQPHRWRCLLTGCNPVLNETTAKTHNESTGHRVAKWPQRSAKGQKKANKRNRTGYYDQYNYGSKSYEARVDGGHIPDTHSGGYGSNSRMANGGQSGWDLGQE